MYNFFLKQTLDVVTDALANSSLHKSNLNCNCVMKVNGHPSHVIWSRKRI